MLYIIIIIVFSINILITEKLIVRIVGTCINIMKTIIRSITLTINKTVVLNVLIWKTEFKELENMVSYN